MSAVVNTSVDGSTQWLPSRVVRNAEAQVDEVVELDSHELWRLDGDNRWKMVSPMPQRLLYPPRCERHGVTPKRGRGLPFVQRCRP